MPRVPSSDIVCGASKSEYFFAMAPDIVCSSCLFPLFRIVVPQPELTASEHSIASSTIIMPSEAPSLTTANVASINEPHQATNATSASHSASLDDISTIESDISEDSDASLWADARPAAHPAAPRSESEAEFILVSDRSSTDGM